LIAELISVGTELLLGEIVDSNAAYLAQELKSRSATLLWKTTVGDNLERIVEAIKRGIARSDVVILGGGLGPTDDDLTREAIAAVMNETPVIDEAYLRQLRAFFESRGRSFPETNTKQAWVLPSGEALPNPVGTAPGWYVKIPDGKIIVAMPGPPREMKRMWTEQVLPRLPLPTSSLYTITFRTNAIGESHIAERLSEWTQSANPSVATYARRDGVHVRVAASGTSLEEARKIASSAETAVLERLEGFVYGTDEQTLPGLIGTLLFERSQTIATMESMTGGLIADELTNIPGASRYVVGGAVTYTNDAKTRMGVNPATIDAHGAVSRETALEMARATRKTFGSSWGLSTTGVAGPDASEGKPVGTLFVGVSGPGFEKVFELSSVGDRRTLKERAAFLALGSLWRALTGRARPEQA
jgi:nicotinamide-nucleotide amidase